jgi:threonine/homoserine/homoserine lactone efflux protein
MRMEQIFISTFGLGLAYCATPGAVNTESLRRGMARGFWPALLVQLGSLIGDTLWALLALTGTAFLVQNGSARLALGIAGACFLLRLAWSALRDAWSGAQPRAEEAPARGDFLTGAFFSLTNPVAVAFWLGVGGGIIATATSHPQAGTLVTLMVGFILGALLWCLSSAALIAWGRRLLGYRFFRWLNGLCGITLGHLGLKTLWRALGALRIARILIG